MYVAGHVGAALSCFAPVAAWLTATGETELAAVGTVTAVAVSGLPDVDHSLGVEHRGLTHTVWFVAAMGLVAAGLGWLAGDVVGESVPLAWVFGTAVFVSGLSHLLADSITPTGVRPFAPLSDWHHTFDIVPAANHRANAAVLTLGLVLVAAVVALVV
jgi:inner membrane protein